MQRSPTAEALFQNWKGRWESKSAGIEPWDGGRPLTQELVDWADLILVMEPFHMDYVAANFQQSQAKVMVLNITDRYYRDDPELLRELRVKVTPILEAL